MNQCIYSGETEKSATFNSAEHIFPKCIGGVRCLPKGWVSDAVNNAFSKLELNFARGNPTVALSRMFFGSVGRKKHAKKDRIGVFQNATNTSDYSLGYIRNASPYPINQIAICSEALNEEYGPIPVKVTLAPSKDKTYEELIASFWDTLRSYNGSPTCIKSKAVPVNTYLLGFNDGCWYFGISEKENPENVKPHLLRLVQKMSAVEAEKTLPSTDKIIRESHQVKVELSFECKYYDNLRVYAKIAVSCLAALKGKEILMSPAFDGIKVAIINGTNIDKYVWRVDGPSPVPGIFQQFPEELPLGKKCHATTFIQKDKWVYALITLYGMDNPMLVKLGMIDIRVEMDFYICDWENGTDYTLNDCVLKICGHDE